MQATDVLQEEHEVINQVLDCLEKIAQQCEETGKLDVASAQDAVDFFRNFADRCHHGKEEAHLFPLLEKRGFSKDAGPTAVMRLEHDQGRACVKGMSEAIAAAKEHDPGAAKRFVTHAQAYVELLRQHIQKENQCLFPMANQALGDVDQKALMSAFEKVEHEEIGAGVHEKQLAIANALAARFHVAKSKAQPAHCCHG